jgi:hypothetical protein
MAASLIDSRHREIQKCYLLELPGGEYTLIQQAESVLIVFVQLELRNRIYHFAREENDIGYISRRLDVYAHDELVDCDITISQPEYLGLTRVCRQIRAEYSPVYADTTRVHVRYVDLKEYMDNGFPHLTRDKDANIVGNLYIDCENLPHGDDNDGDADFISIDIRPFLQCCKNLPSLKVQCGFHACDCPECQKDWAGIKDYVNILFKINENPRLQAWIDTAVKAIWLRFEAELQFDIRQSKFKEWMKDSDGRSHDPVYIEWAQQTGLNIANFTGQGFLIFDAN